jgi:hypothetical protein
MKPPGWKKLQDPWREILCLGHRIGCCLNRHPGRVGGGVLNRWLVEVATDKVKFGNALAMMKVEFAKAIL